MSPVTLSVEGKGMLFNLRQLSWSKHLDTLSTRVVQARLIRVSSSLSLALSRLHSLSQTHTHTNTQSHTTHLKVKVRAPESGWGDEKEVESIYPPPTDPPGCGLHVTCEPKAARAVCIRVQRHYTHTHTHTHRSRCCRKQ